tara:strand:- start:7713 stop:8894 length:1182 start_codon:yes stop_codon:yes gene_type:complete
MPLKYLVLYLFLLGSPLMAISQLPTLSEDAGISVITCGSGNELYSTFGHSAFRLQDPVLGIDVVYNYGTFNFREPNFYMKFAQGKLLYSLSRQKFEDFLWEYELENRWVKEQLLDLSPEGTKALFEFLENNYRPENRDYKYDFLFNNCATKLPEILGKVYGEQLVFHNYLKERFTFRELIHQNLNTNSWSAFGIDIALGSVIDREATPYQHMFLPNYVMEQLDRTTLDGKPLVERSRTILESTNKSPDPYFLASPLFWLLALMAFTVIITGIDLKNHSRSRSLDFVLFFLSGITGVLIIFLWFFTDHTATAGNFNILWAFPLNLVVAFFLAKKGPLPKWSVVYLILLLLLLVLLLALWIAGFQIFSPLIVPLLFLFGARYFFLLYYQKGNLNK